MAESAPTRLHDDEQESDGAEHTRFISTRAAGLRLSPHLIVAAGAYSVGRYVAARDGAVIGRAPDADLMLLEEGVSRKHAKVAIDPVTEDVWLEDLGSKNGLVVDGKRVARVRVGLTDVVELGRAALTLVRLQSSERLSSNMRIFAAHEAAVILSKPEFVAMLRLTSRTLERAFTVVLVAPAKGSVTPFVLRRLAQLSKVAAKGRLDIGRVGTSVLGLLFSTEDHAERSEAIDLLQQAAAAEEVFEDGPRPPLVTRSLTMNAEDSFEAVLEAGIQQLSPR
ncbi:MAG TPA: FHA domain-containing protein [Labilithrix sp.]|nr:FHA domain-containing protein [Labilithrix sp.]